MIKAYKKAYNSIQKHTNFFNGWCRGAVLVALLVGRSVRCVAVLCFFLRHFFDSATPTTPNFAHAFYLYPPIQQVGESIKKSLQKRMVMI